ncbi:unnamed protein product, partial [Onchocerca flexuosa]|uniref:SUN domain-containing protein n=1 Tax=Onchocerca flexuosa TaxID=387005 RepID=A0A183H4J4_9BILA
NRHSSSALHSSAIYRKNSFPAACLSQHDIVNFVQSFSSDDDQHADAEYYVPSRRKRFTRRQRRNLTGGVFGKRTSKSTSALNKVYRSESTSSSDNDNINERRKRSIELATTSKRGQSTTSRRATTSTEARFLSLRQNYVNSSLITRSTTEICCSSTSTRPSTSIEPTDSFQKFKGFLLMLRLRKVTLILPVILKIISSNQFYTKIIIIIIINMKSIQGPTARKARRRTLRHKLNSFVNNQFETKAGSQAGLDVHADNIQSEKSKLVRRSVSVRELNGTMIDFTNQDSVTRWTSQILAEIDSLPSSSFDLTGQSTPQSSPFINTATSGAITDSIISSTAIDADIVRPNEFKYDSLKQNMQSPVRNNSNISFEMGIMNSTPSAQWHDNESQISLPTLHHRSQKIASKSNSSHFIKFQKRNSCKKVSFLFLSIINWDK